MGTRIFIHGLESSSQGTKGLFFRELFPDMLLPNFKGSLEERMKSLEGLLADKTDIRIVGSSFGGLMGAIYAMENESRVNRLVLLAPALNLFGFSRYESRKISIPVHVYHGTEDDVIPILPIKHLAVKIFSNLSFNTVEDDHFLHKTFKAIHWRSLLD